MQVREIDRHKLTKASLAVIEQAGVFASSAWTDLYAGKTKLLGIFNDNDELIGTFSIFVFKKYSLTIIINPPFAPHVNLHYINPAQTPSSVNAFNKQVMQCIADYLLGTGAHYIKLNFSGTIIDTQALVWKGFEVSNRFTYVLDLHLTEEELYNNLSSEKKKSLRKAEKDGIVVSAEPDPEKVFSLIRQSLERSGKFSNEAYIRGIVLNFANTSNSLMFTAKDPQGNTIAAAFCVRTTNKAYYLFGGFDETHKHHGAGVSCMWACIQQAKRAGLSEFDFEGSMVPEIEKYFREFGGQIRPLQEISFKRFPYKQLSLVIKK
ncbi:MAG: GNAT family N-acetyltransferase [Bacteroidetes bacterium]|nr:GNAT family N-acetyltransferase [Bacteroidota bacterium]